MILLRFLSCFLTFQVAFSSNQAAPTQQEDLKSKSQSAKTPTPSQEQTSEIRASDPLPSLPQSSSHHTLRIDPSSDAHSSSDSHPKEDHSYTLKDWLFNLLRKLGTSIPAWIHSTTEKIIAINYEDLPEDIKTWIKENPKQTAFYVFQGVVFFAPGLLSAPLLRLLGFTPKGPVGPLASKIMAQIGPVARRSLYATFQSAGMGGYGRAAVNGVVRGGNAVMGAVKWWKNSGKNEEEDAERGDKKKGKERRGKPGRGQMVGVQNKSFEDLVADRLCCVTKTHQEESD